MLVTDKEEKIIEKIQEITGIEIDINRQVCYDLVKDFREYRIKKILLISSSFDYFSLEEEGRLSNLFSEWCSFDEKEYPPVIVHVETAEECIKKIEKENFNLIVIFNEPKKCSFKSFLKNIKSISNSPVVLLWDNVDEIFLDILKENKENISKAFTWNGDGKILVSIVKYFEDQKNIEISSSVDIKNCILLIEDSIQHYSSYISLIIEEICIYLNKIINDKLSCEQKLLRYKRRPFIIHSDNYEEGVRFSEKYKNDLICVITDNVLEENGFKKQIGVDFAHLVFKHNPDLPVLIQSSEPVKKEKIVSKNVFFVSKNSNMLLRMIRNFIKENLGPLEIVIKDKKGKKVVVDNLNDFEKSLESFDNSDLFKCAKSNMFSDWMKTIGEVELASKCKVIENEIGDSFSLKKEFVDLIEDYHYSVNLTSISSFSNGVDIPVNKLSRIGAGALGGKARGLAFIAKIISKYLPEELFPGLKITIPRSIVLSTDVFDLFMDHNHLSDLDFYHLSDDRIAAKFMEASLPATILGDLRSFIKKTRMPIIVRSSGLLEDSLMQPFAGIYASMLLPNESWGADIRFQEVCNSVKYVYASTYFERARTYIKNTPKHIGDEKMAVLLQEISGMKHENYFYPTISGVAKSYNYYPSGPCKPEEGIVYLALGLGKSIVDGGSSYAFCPERPKAPLFGTQKYYMKYAQTKYYALNLKAIYRFANYTEETSLDKLDIEDAKNHKVLDKIASTYMPQDDSIYPGLYENGYTVVDFAPIINYDEIPLAKALKLLLQISEIALGYPVEIEFAVNLPKDTNKSAELIILQIRNMMPLDKNIDINLEEIPKENTIVFSENALGNGIIENLKDIVYVDQNKFDLSNSNQVVNQIKDMNAKLMESKKPYILIGPGRWGSTDPWLGIPVIWSNIAGAKVIVEIPYKERHIDPSQGSHFFHDMIASQVVYLITKKEQDTNWNWIKKQKIVEKTEFIKHIQIQKSLDAIADGKIGKGIIIEKKKK